MNILKLNLAAIALNNYQLTYERVFNKRIAASVSYRFMPEGNLPFKNYIRDQVGSDDPETNRLINDVMVKNNAFTADLRFYLSRGYGYGFYLGAFYRYANFDASNASVTYEGDNGEKTVQMAGNLKAHTGGMTMGAQARLARNLVLDIGFFGPHIGGAKGVLEGTPSTPFSSVEQQDIKDVLENEIDIPIVDKTVTVTPNKATMNLSGPWAGYRFLLGLGFRF